LRLKWAYGARQPVGDPIVHDGTVYFVSVGRRLTSRMHAVDLASGRKIWKGRAYRDLGGKAITDGEVLLGFFSRGDGDVWVLRYEPDTGRLIWRAHAGANGGAHFDPVLADGIVYWSDGDIYGVRALDAASGNEGLLRELDCSGCGIAAANGRVYAAGRLVEISDQEPLAVYALDALSGTTIWSTPAPAGVELADYDVFSVVLADERVIAVTKSPSQQGGTRAFFLEAFRATDGERLWRTAVGTTDAWPYTLPAADETQVVFPSPDGNLYALNAEDGSLRWKVKIGVNDRPVSEDYGPAIANGVVWIVTVDGAKDRLTAFDASNGRQLWHSKPFKHIDDLYHHPSPVIAGGYVLVGTNGGRMLAYQTRTP
jgi:outer membrane protein assembly factor BamB